MIHQSSSSRLAGFIGGQRDVYSFELNSGTVVSSHSGSSGATPLGEGIAVPHSSSDLANRSTSELWRLVLIDKLTGLCNQHGFIALAEQQWKISRRLGREMVFVGLEVAGLLESCLDCRRQDIGQNVPPIRHRVPMEWRALQSPGRKRRESGGGRAECPDSVSIEEIRRSRCRVSVGIQGGHRAHQAACLRLLCTGLDPPRSGSRQLHVNLGRAHRPA